MEPRFSREFVIGDIPIRLEAQLPLPMEEAFLPFLAQGQSPAYVARFTRVDALPPFSPEILWMGNCDCTRPREGGGYLRTFFGPQEDRPTYAVGTYDYPRGQILLQYLDRGRPFLDSLSTCFYHIGLEAILRQEEKFCLHASLVQTPLGGLVFSGPSGIGKSTQADLWCRYRQSRLLNGDRPILGRKAGRWTGWGSPYAGSSRCYVNDACPLSAIFMLEQARTCSLRPLGPARACREIFKMLTVYSWDPAFTAAAFDFSVRLAREVPVYVFACTPEERAVDFLENALRDSL